MSGQWAVYDLHGDLTHITADKRPRCGRGHLLQMLSVVAQTNDGQWIPLEVPNDA